MKPFKNIESHNLSLLLLTARFTAVVGEVFLVVAIIATLISLSAGIAGIVSAIVFIPSAIGILLLSGVMAALVSFEDNYRKRTEAMISGSEIVESE